VLARVGKGFDVDAARRELSAIAVALGDEYPDSNRSWSVTVRPLIETVVSPEFRRSVLLLTGAVAFVLLIACANVTSLLLSRATVRRREMAIRAALGANRAQLVRLLLVESVVLAAAAGALGVMLAVWGVEVLKRLDPGSIPRLDEVTLSAPVLVVAGFASLLTALVFGIVPALTSASGTGTELRTRESSPDRRTSRSRDLLVLGEVALAVVLLIGAGLMMRSFVRLQQRALGFDAGSLMTAQLATPPERPSQASDTTAATERILARLAELPGVSNVAGGSRLPFAGPNSGNVFEIEGVVHPSDERPDTDYRVVTADYFRTLAIPLIRGRVFTPGDGPAAPAVVISASTARRYWANRDPLGARVRLGDSPWMTVVGVVGDARYFAIDAPGDSVRPMMYVPHAQMPDVWLMFAIRTRTAPDALAETLRSTLSAAVPEAPVVSIEPMSAILAQALGPQRFGTTLFAVFAWVAVFLAAAGVYGLIAYFVSCRTREIGVRVALGASTTDIVRMTAGRGIVLSAGGLVTGLAVARALSGLLSRVLFEVSPVDPATYAVVAIGFLALAAAASYVPARRALQIDPARTLNAE
jgi:predicted permease